MRKSKIIKIGDREYTLKELRVRDIYELAAGEEAETVKRLDDMLQRCSDIKRSDLMDMTPTDISVLWDGFREVNSAFLELAAGLGLGGLQEVVRKNLHDQFVMSLSQDMAV